MAGTDRPARSEQASPQKAKSKKTTGKKKSGKKTTGRKKSDTKGAKKPDEKKAGKNKPAKKGHSKKASKPKRIKRKGQRESDVSSDLYVATSAIHGRGMFAENRIKKNVVLGKLEGKPTRDDGTYVLWLTARKGMRLTNDFRFINHDKKPNCALTGKDVVTLRAIRQDEELTHDYGW